MPKDGRLPHFGVMQKVFNDEEIDRIKFFEKILQFKPLSTLGTAPAEEQNYRVANGAALLHDEHTGWLYDRFFHIIAQANYDLFLYDIESMEELGYTIYEGTDKGGYKPHRDNGNHFYNRYDRKISIIAMLSEPSEYEGGDFLIDLGGGQPKDTWSNVELNKGDVIFFDSSYIHEVTPVTSGKRSVLITWAHGKSKL